MQSIQWYIRRMRAMSPAEVAWRGKSCVIDVLDRALISARRRKIPLSKLIDGEENLDVVGFRVCDVPVGQWAMSDNRELTDELYNRLLASAEAILAHRLTFLDMEDCYLGDPIDWNYDFESHRSAPMAWSGSIDYRDSAVSGDCKLVWEPSRHHQLVVLGRAYRASGIARYAAGVVEQIDSWLDQCPYGAGMQWRSGLEIGIRLINWVWAIDMIRESGLATGEFRARLLNAVYRQVWEVARKYSRGSSANNHLVGEAAGVFVAASYFCNLKHAAKYRTQSRDILVSAIMEQTYDDGGYREQAIGYHLFAAQLFLVAGLAGRWTGLEFPKTYSDRLALMFEFLSVMGEGGRRLPMIGDADDGYVLELGSDPRDHRQWLEAAGGLWGRDEFRQSDPAGSETASWLLRKEDRARLSVTKPPSGNTEIISKALVESGYYLLQAGRGDQRISVVFDCGDMGLEPMAGHAHADALSFTLRAFGVDVLVDPGTYDYFSYPQQREFYRSTRAHNTVVIDQCDQALMQGPFLWGAKPHLRCLIWQRSWTAARVKAQHDGYMRLADPVAHAREIEFDGARRAIMVTDEIRASARHQVEVRFHLGENCIIERVGNGDFLIDTGAGKVKLAMDRRLNVEVLSGGTGTLDGWVSRGYHRRAASTTLIGRCEIDGSATFATRIEVGLPASRMQQLSAQMLEASTFGEPQ